MTFDSRVLFDKQEMRHHIKEDASRKNNYQSLDSNEAIVTDFEEQDIRTEDDYDTEVHKMFSILKVHQGAEYGRKNMAWYDLKGARVQALEIMSDVYRASSFRDVPGIKNAVLQVIEVYKGWAPELKEMKSLF
ncbi:hypothetical protein GOV05_05315 [Candidatus Woesearchaeota archaeon]|nr:hypothetical protein [Candidatus Woesearchaeota archaeon]